MHPVENRKRSNIVVADLGGTWLKLRAMRHGEVLAEEVIHPITKIRTASPTSSLSHLITGFAEECALKDYSLVITVPGFIDLDFDTILHSNNIPELRGIRLCTELQSLLGQQVIVERDAVLTLLGEYDRGVARGRDGVLGIFFGTGIGAAFVSAGKPFRGGGWALELGHIPYGGNTHTLEDFGSGRVLSALAERYNLEVGKIFNSTGNRADLAEALEEFISVQANAIAIAIALYAPKLLVLGGGVLEMDGYPRDALIRRMLNRVSPRYIRDPEIRWSSLGWRGALFGASYLLRQRSSPACEAEGC